MDGAPSPTYRPQIAGNDGPGFYKQLYERGRHDDFRQPERIDDPFRGSRNLAGFVKTGCRSRLVFSEGNGAGDDDGLVFLAAAKSRVRNPVDQQRWGSSTCLNFDFVDKKRVARTAANRRSLAAPLRFLSAFDEGAGLDPIACRRIGAVSLRGRDRSNEDQEEFDHRANWVKNFTYDLPRPLHAG